MQPLHAQSNNLFNNNRFNKVVITEAAVTTACLVGLHYLWYKKFPHSRFHLFNDNKEWFYMDKIGHATTAYNISGIQYDMMRWSGVENRRAAWIGGLTALGIQTIVEVFDGFSVGWGFSKGDMLANITGAALFVGQQVAWGEQRAHLKFSFHKTIYASYNSSELGSNKWQRWLKDYNGQTYWLSINPHSFLPSNTDVPRFMNVAIGYGAQGMIGASSNPSFIKNQAVPDFKRQSRWLLSLDADLKRIDQTNDLKAFLSIPNILKVPAPALEFKKGAPIKGYFLYF
jgi:uncharacterized protein YfiM (DUF2279 family)